MRMHRSGNLPRIHENASFAVRHDEAARVIVFERSGLLPGFEVDYEEFKELEPAIANSDPNPKYEELERICGGSTYSIYREAFYDCQRVEFSFLLDDERESQLDFEEEEWKALTSAVAAVSNILADDLAEAARIQCSG